MENTNITYEALVELLDEMGYSIYEEAADRRDDLLAGKNIGAIGVAAAALLVGPVGMATMALPLVLSGAAYLVSVARSASLTGKFQAIPFSKESLFSIALQAASGEKLVRVDQNTDPVSAFMGVKERALWTLTSQQMLGPKVAQRIWDEHQSSGLPITEASIRRHLSVAVDALERSPNLIEDPLRTLAVRGKENFTTEFFTGLNGDAPQTLLEEVEEEEVEALPAKKFESPVLDLEIGDDTLTVEFEEVEELIEDNVVPLKETKTILASPKPQPRIEKIVSPMISDPSPDREGLVNISRDLITPVKSTIILGKPGAGKGHAVSNAVDLLISKDEGWEIWFVDPKDDKNEGYFDAFLPPSRMLKSRLPSAINEDDLDLWTETACEFIIRFQKSKATKKLLIWDECTNSIAKLGIRFKKYIVPELVDVATMGRSSNTFVWMMGQSDGLADWGITGGSRDVFRRVGLINQIKGDVNCDSSFSSGRTTFFNQTPLPRSVGRTSDRVAYDSQRLNADSSHGWVGVYSEGALIKPVSTRAAISIQEVEEDPWEETVDCTVSQYLKDTLQPGDSIYISRLVQSNVEFRNMDSANRELLIKTLEESGDYSKKGKSIIRVK